MPATLTLTPRLWVSLLLLIGCAREGARTSQVVESRPRVEIVAPAEGDSVSQPFTVRLLAHGAEVVPASGIREEGRGHHHLVIDADLPSPDLALPTDRGFIHMGTGAAERVIDSLAPGPHRIIAVLGFGDHVPLPTVATDTINIVVR